MAKRALRVSRVCVCVYVCVCVSVSVSACLCVGVGVVTAYARFQKCRARAVTAAAVAAMPNVRAHSSDASAAWQGNGSESRRNPNSSARGMSAPKACKQSQGGKTGNKPREGVHSQQGRHGVGWEYKGTHVVVVACGWPLSRTHRGRRTACKSPRSCSFP